MRRFVVLLIAVLFHGVAVAEPKPDKVAEEKKEEPVPEARVWVTQHEIELGGKRIAYTATAGTMLMKNAKGEPIALFGYTAYIANAGARDQRPLLFAYNGGPGSASIWLHMGILGPQRTVLNDPDPTPNGPFRRVDNEFSVLDVADLVMIDPVGTGISRPVGKAKGKDFWGVDQDIESVSEFIVRYLGDNGRWASPKYILGESYGGVRSGGVAYHLLTKHNVALNGVILVSPYMDFVAGNAGLKMDLPYINYLSTYAATAWYHEAVADRPAELQTFVREADTFARDVYAPVLLKGNRASVEERKRVLEGLHRYTGISEDYWDRANLRIDESRFVQELLRERRQVAGRIDSRYMGDTINPLSEAFRYDPFFPAVGPAIVATFNDYYRKELEVETEQRYVISANIWNKWDWSHQQPDVDGQKVAFVNTAIDLAHTMTQNPNMKVLVQQGYYDLATPVGATDYFVDHLEISAALRANISVKYYEAGHMMYTHPESMVLFSRDLSRFIGGQPDD